MSAFMCNRRTILAVAVLSKTEVRYLGQKLADPQARWALLGEISTTARELAVANDASVAYRYGETPDPEIADRLFPHPLTTTSTRGVTSQPFSTPTPYGEALQRDVRALLDVPVVALLKAVQCFEYQTSELPDYEAQPWYRHVTRALSRGISALPGYDDAPWGLS